MKIFAKVVIGAFLVVAVVWGVGVALINAPYVSSSPPDHSGVRETFNRASIHVIESDQPLAMTRAECNDLYHFGLDHLLGERYARQALFVTALLLLLSCSVSAWGLFRRRVN